MLSHFTEGVLFKASLGPLGSFTGVLDTHFVKRNGTPPLTWTCLFAVLFHSCWPASCVALAQGACDL